MVSQSGGIAPAIEPDFYSAKGRFSGILSWILSTDHKRIGLLYFITMSVFFSIAVTLGFLMRLELLTPGKTIMDPQTYNTFFTLHGIIMIFLFIIPGLPAVFGNFFLPIMIGARDVFFPRLNLLSWWLFVTGGLLALTSLFLPGGAADTGLDVLRSLQRPDFDQRSPGLDGSVYSRFLLDTHGSQLCHYGPPYACQGDDLVQNATFRVGPLLDGLGANPGNPDHRDHAFAGRR